MYIHKRALFLLHSDFDAVTVNVETHELVIDAARCIASAEDSTNHTEVFVSPEQSPVCSSCMSP